MFRWDAATRCCRPTYRVEVGGHIVKESTSEVSFSVPEYTRSTFRAPQPRSVRFFERLGGNGDDLHRPGDRVRLRGHIVGTCRMGRDASDSVVDDFGRAHEHPNLYLVGAATFPTIGTANPTLTLAALTLRTADAILGDTT